MTLRRLAILGVGLLGGSLALAVKKRINSCKIVGYAHRQQTLEAAMRLGLLDEGYGRPQEAVKDAELVVLCTPVSLLGPLVREIAAVLEPGAIVTDVGSTKRTVVAAGEETLRSAHFVGSHPMAGSEKRGLEHAEADLFEGAVCIVTPTERTNGDALQRVEEFWRLVGMRVIQLAPDEHDRLLADVSHLPHVIAAALVAMQQDEALGLCGKGFVDLTRIAGGDGALWRDILLDNRDNLRQSLRKLAQTLAHFEELLEESKLEQLQAWLDAAARRRRQMADNLNSHI